MDKQRLFFSWTSLSIFVFLLVFQPARWTFYAIRPSDVWLVISVLSQYKSRRSDWVYFRGRYLVKYFGVFLGVIAIIATVVQARHTGVSLNNSFVFHFYRFLRFFFIFIFIENIYNDSEFNKERSFLLLYTFLGAISVVMIFLEYYAVQPYQLSIISLYYQQSEYTLKEYLYSIERVAGVLGNSNATAIFLSSTLVYPSAYFFFRKGKLFEKLVVLTYIISVLYALFTMLGSRTAALSILIIPIAFLLKSLASRRTLLKFSLSMGVLLVILFAMTNSNSFEIPIQERIASTFKEDTPEGSFQSLGIWTDRYYLWADRFRTFHQEGNQLKEFIGMGYTKAFYDYADNGFISAYLNNGIFGLSLKLFLFYLFFKTTFRWLKRKSLDDDFLPIVFPTIVILLMLFEITADLIEHYKLGQIFYVFLCVSFLVLNQRETQKI